MSHVLVEGLGVRGCVLICVGSPDPIENQMLESLLYL